MCGGCVVVRGEGGCVVLCLCGGCGDEYKRWVLFVLGLVGEDGVGGTQFCLCWAWSAKTGWGEPSFCLCWACSAKTGWGEPRIVFVRRGRRKRDGCSLVLLFVGRVLRNRGVSVVFCFRLLLSLVFCSMCVAYRRHPPPPCTTVSLCLVPPAVDCLML